MIPFIDFGGTGQPMHFTHANGYPPACYLPLIEFLKGHYHVFGMLLRPLWPDQKPESVDDWRPFSDDLLELLTQNLPNPIIGIGHSIGAIVTLRAAMREPRHFRALVLIDPVFFPPHFIIFLNMINALGLGYRLNPYVSSTLHRRRVFKNLEHAFLAYRRHRVFRYFSDENLRAYVQGIVKPAGDGRYELAYSPEWEARLYSTSGLCDMDIWHGLAHLDVPILIIRGAETNTFWASTARRVQRILPTVRVVTVPRSTHLVPLERPKEVAQSIHEFLREIS